MRFITKTLVTSLAVLLAGYLLKNHGITVNGSISAIMVALMLGLLNSFIKPILILLTIPITVFTFGIFFIVINVFMVELTSKIVDDFIVRDWIAALLFSVIVSLTTSFLEKFISNNTEEKTDK